MTFRSVAVTLVSGYMLFATATLLSFVACKHRITSRTWRRHRRQNLARDPKAAAGVLLF